MAYQYINRRGDVYHLQRGKPRGSRETFSFARKLSGEPAEAVPEGYEVYEKPDNAQVLLRRIKPTDILPFERELIEDAVRRRAKLEHFIVDVEPQCLVIYLPDTSPGEAAALIREFAARPGALDVIVRQSRYSKVMRFKLENRLSGRFQLQRWCFRGSIDEWIFLSGPTPLEALLEKYIRHLGKESFFELM